MRNATPFGQSPEVALRDRDDKFGADFDRVVQGVHSRVVRTAVQAPLHQGIGQRVPAPAERAMATAIAEVKALPLLGGLHHDYRPAV